MMIAEAFAQFGQVVRVDAHIDREYAFVEFGNVESLRAALSSPVVCCGAALRVEERASSTGGSSSVNRRSGEKSSSRSSGRGSASSGKSTDRSGLRSGAGRDGVSGSSKHNNNSSVTNNSVKTLGGQRKGSKEGESAVEHA